MDYAILLSQHHNRVYYESSKALSLAEFQIVSAKLKSDCSQIEIKSISGIDYLTFHTAESLTEQDIETISRLSFAFSLYELRPIDSQNWLRPIEMIKLDFVDESIGSMLKYTGKTNELFTRMMINIAYFSLNHTEEIKLLDPVAGKGTTLFEGLVKGFDVYGIEIADKVVNESYLFMKRFLEDARYKYEYTKLRVSGPNRSFTAVRHTFVTAPTKVAFKNQETKTIEFIAGNSLYANSYHKRGFFDIIAGDLPYGVQHGNVTNEKQSALTRNPYELLKHCLPVWVELLKDGGVIVLAWNCNTLSRSSITELFSANGLTPIEQKAYLQLQHRVDSAIVRDVIVATKQ
ncbi:MAG: hypothetical protein FWG21_02460 [Oscillospiraceae bacterium]|nr:hypothetical protein [Oscillospiraceae bacterium]